MLFVGNLNTVNKWELARTVIFNKQHFQKVQGKRKSSIRVRFATEQTVILEMERPPSVWHRLFCNFACDLPEKNSSPLVPDKELAPSNSPHSATSRDTPPVSYT